MGKEVETDSVCDGENCLVVGIMEHIERAGVHSGDSFAVYPTQTLSQKIKDTVVEYTQRIGKELGIKGLFNIQFIIDEKEDVYVLEVNPRASRTVPILSKITGVPMVSAATRIMLGETLADIGYSSGLHKESKLITVKAPVFSFSKLTNVDIFLGPEMKSTGEVMGTDTTYLAALRKAFVASGVRMPDKSKPVLFSVTPRDIEESLQSAQKMIDMGFNIAGTDGTCAFYRQHSLKCMLIKKEDVVVAIKNHEVTMVVNTPTRGKLKDRLGFILRRTTMEWDVPCITSLDTLHALLSIVDDTNIKQHLIPLHEYLNYQEV